MDDFSTPMSEAYVHNLPDRRVEQLSRLARQIHPGIEAFKSWNEAQLKRTSLLQQDYYQQWLVVLTRLVGTLPRTDDATV